MDLSQLTAAELVKLVEDLRDRGVSHFRTGQLELTIAPTVPVVKPMDLEKASGAKKDLVAGFPYDEDDLYGVKLGE